jgi:hypothetical protein
LTGKPSLLFHILPSSLLFDLLVVLHSEFLHSWIVSVVIETPAV